MFWRFESFTSECTRCTKTHYTFVGSIRHDLRCWGWKVALSNLWVLLTWPKDAFTFEA